MAVDGLVVDPGPLLLGLNGGGGGLEDVLLALLVLASLEVGFQLFFGLFLLHEGVVDEGDVGDEVLDVAGVEAEVLLGGLLVLGIAGLDEGGWVGRALLLPFRELELGGAGVLGGVLEVLEEMAEVFLA